MEQSEQQHHHALQWLSKEAQHLLRALDKTVDTFVPSLQTFHSRLLWKGDCRSIWEWMLSCLGTVLATVGQNSSRCSDSAWLSLLALCPSGGPASVSEEVRQA